MMMMMVMVMMMATNDDDPAVEDNPAVLWVWKQGVGMQAAADETLEILEAGSACPCCPLCCPPSS